MIAIQWGLGDGALLQRDENGFCDCTFGAEAVGELRCSLGNLTALGDGKYRLTGIPTGGPYSVTLSDDTDSMDLKLWVGDLWLLGGQSNMEGAGRFTENDLWDEANPNPNIRAYYLDNRWDAAKPMLHEPWLSVDACQREVWRESQLASLWHSDLPPHESHGVPKQGIGPGLFFAKKLYEITGGVPQAVIPAALGGSGLHQWDPEGQDNLYHAMIARVKRVGGKVRGLFWYQGCSETHAEGVSAFTERMVHLVQCVRRDCGDENLPFVQVQIAKNNLHGCNTLESGLLWEAIREKQRLLHTQIPHMDTVAAIDGAPDDLIHLSSIAQEQVGLRGALSMAKLCGFGGAAAPKLRGMELRPDEARPFWWALVLRFDQVNQLVSRGAPAGFTITRTPEELLLMPELGIARIGFERDSVILYTEMTREELLGCYVRYGYLNMSHCTIGEANGHLLPAFGPLAIADYVKQ